MQSWLVLFGWLAIITSILLIIVPFLRGRRDLINTWTLFHVGCANFIGFTAIQSGNAWTHMYLTPTENDFVRFLFAGVTFYVVSIFTYYFFKFPDRLAGRTFLKWAPRSPRVLLSMVPICALLVMGFIFVPNVQFLGQWMTFFGRNAGIIAVVFCMAAWAQRPFNITIFAALAASILLATVVGNIGAGRREFLSVIVAVPFCWYWLRARSYNPARTITTLAVFAIIGAILLAGVSVIRHRGSNPDLSVVQAAWEKVKAIPAAFRESGKTQSLFGGDTTEASLSAIQLYTTVLEPQPFHLVKYVLSHPVPRKWWPDKPDGLGISLPHDVGWFSLNYGYLNIGPGIIGHGYHEGGLHMVAFYAMLFALIMRYVDALLMRDPSNPYLLGMIGATSGQIIAFVRGDCALFAVVILGGFIVGYVINLIARLLFGTERLMPADQLPVEQYAAAEYDYSLGYQQPY